MTETVAVFGGAFDPPHMGHALVPAWVLARGLASRVLVVPSYAHALGKQMSPFVHRLAWTRLAMAGLGPRVQVSDLEARLPREPDAPCYTIDVLAAVREQNPGANVRLVIGSDILATGETARWHRWDDISTQFDPIVVPRAGHAPASECLLPDVSSTSVRERVARGDWDALESRVPAAVLGCIKNSGRGRIWLIGRGHVATHAGPWLATRGYDVVVIGARDLIRGNVLLTDERPAAVWVLCSDPFIPRVAEALRDVGLPQDVPVLHAAGAIRSAGPRGLQALERAGNPVGTLHPICSLRLERDTSPHLLHAGFGLEGSDAARAMARSWIAEQPVLDLQPLDDDGRAAYHAACALAANHLSVLHEQAASVLAPQGHTRRTIDDVLTVLMSSALDNFDALGFPAGVSGPVSRGDQAGVRAHIKALPSDASGLYKILSARLGALLA